MNEQEIEAKLKRIENPEPLDRGFRLNLKKRLMNQLEYQQNEEVRMKESKLQNMQDLQNKKKHSTSGFFGRLGLSGVVFSLFMVLSLSSVMAYYSFPDVKNTVNDLVGIKQKGTLSLTTIPDDAVVYLNGENLGNTPFNKELTTGNYALKITKEGYKNYYQSITIKKDESTTLDIGLEVAAPVDKYSDWLVYNNTDKGFGFRYPGDWTISEEDKSQSVDQSDFLVKLKKDNPDGINKGFEISVNYLSKKPDMTECGTSCTAIDINGGTFFSITENNETTGYYLMNTGKVYLYVTLAGTQISESDTDIIVDFMKSVWLDSDVQTQGYKSPSTKVTPKFVWQQGDTVYNMGVTGNLPVSKFTFKGNQIGSLSPDYKWILYNDASGISIIDNEGKNGQRLISLPTSSGSVHVNASTGNGAWSKDSNYFTYLIMAQNCPVGSDECDYEFLDEGLGFKSGLYLFNMKTGTSAYIDGTKDAVDNGASVNWSADSKYLYYIKDGDEKGKVVVDEYSIDAISSSNSSKQKNTYVWNTGSAYYSVQMDVYDRDNVVMLDGSIGQDGSIDLARFANGKIEIVKNIRKNVAWASMQWPRYSELKQFIIFNGTSYYDLQKNAWIDLNGSDNNRYNFVAYTTSYAVLAAETVNSMGEPVPMTLRVVDIAFNKEWKVVWTDKTVDKNSSDDFVYFPAAE